jgi:hypothetical protein
MLRLALLGLLELEMRKTIQISKCQTKLQRSLKAFIFNFLKDVYPRDYLAARRYMSIGLLSNTRAPAKVSKNII